MFKGLKPGRAKAHSGKIKAKGIEPCHKVPNSVHGFYKFARLTRAAKCSLSEFSVFRTLNTGTAIRHDAEWIADELYAVMEETGPHLIDLVIRDNAAVCVAAGKLLEARFPKFTSIGCCAHALDLVMKEACRHEWAAKLIASAREVVTFFKAHHLPYRLFREQSPSALFFY